MSDKSVSMVSLPSSWLISDTDITNMGLAYVAANLRSNGVDVTISDLCGIAQPEWSDDRILEEWDKALKPADVYGISLTTPQFPVAQRIAKHIKDTRPGSQIVMGGYHATAMPKHTLEETVADIVVAGDGEEAMLSVVRGDVANAAGTFQDMGGGRGILTAAQIPQDVMQKLPWPARDLFDNLDQYHVVGTNAMVGDAVDGRAADEIREGQLISSRGCPFRCGFCAQMSMSDFKVRYRDSDDVLGEMEHLIDDHGVSRLYFFDDIFIVDKNQVYELCGKFDELQVRKPFDWHCLARVDVPKKGADRDAMYARMFDSGCRQVAYGIEHASDAVLRRIQKDTTSAQNYAAIKSAKDAGMHVRAQLVVGLPGETDETVAEMEHFIRNSGADHVGIHVFVPLPGSPIWNNPEMFGFDWKRDTDFSHYQTIGRPGAWQAHTIHKNGEQVYGWAEHLRSVAGSYNRNAADADSHWRPIRSSAERTLYAADEGEGRPGGSYSGDSGKN